MSATRRLFLILSLAGVALVNAQESKTEPKTTSDNVLSVIPSESQPIGNDAIAGRVEYDEREARMSLQTETPMAKAKREQTLRNILAARRRSALRRRTSSEATIRGALSRRRPVSSREAMFGDVLEMQESQNGLYVTMPEHHFPNETQEIIIRTLGTTTAAASSGGSDGGGGRRSGTMSISSKPYRNNGSIEHRGKKIVSMPDSLYNHFRPVESNIPIEDMSQFLYFGQKLRGTGMGKDSSSASPAPKKLLAGLEYMLDDDMNSVDRSSGSLSVKSTKMRTTSLREQTTRPACPDKVTEARGNSINATEMQKTSSSESSLGLRIVVSEATRSTTIGASADAPSNTTSTALMSSTTSATPRPSITMTTEATTTTTTIKSTTPSTTTTTTTTSTTTTSTTSTEATAAMTTKESSMPATEQEQQQHQRQQHVSEQLESQQQQQQQQQEQKQEQQRQRAALRNSHIAETGELRSSSSSPGAARLSAGATVERVAAPLSSTRAKPAGAPAAAAATAAPQQQSGFTIRWTDARPASASSKRRRPPASRRRDKVARAMEEPATGSPAVARMLDPSEVQKMYRAGSTGKPESPTTELPPPMRSPEVRARNLGDKTKDDVLPIMQLYNTSSMFNGSETSADPGSEPETTTTTMTIPVATPAVTATTESSSSGSSTTSRPATSNNSSGNATPKPKPERHGMSRSSNNTGRGNSNNNNGNNRSVNNRSSSAKPHRREFPGEFNGFGYYPLELNSSNSGNSGNSSNRTSGSNNNNNDNVSKNNRTFLEAPVFVTVAPREPVVNISEVISRRHDGDALASQETVAVVSYILATLVVFPIAVGVGLILRRLILRNRKVLEESDTSSEISCRKDALNLETGDFKMSIEKTITKLPRIQHLCHEVEKPPPPSSQESRWEFSRDKLRLQTVLGEGNFGQVWKAEADDLTGHQGTTRLVAVKTVKEGASDREKEDLVRELEIMQRVGSHPNVVTLLGCCTEQEPHYLILEYVMYGKLLAYLRDHRTRQDFYNFSEDSAALTSRDLTVFGYCVARGMEYLASKKIIHRDLAARNVLVDHNKLCKIADFGMSRFANEDGEVIETRHGRNALPIRWMAPESLIYSLFTTKTDVWSFGILMWEIVTLGSTPYPDMTAREVMRSVQSGYRLERPSHCRSELFRVIARCWHADPDRRPEFQLLRRDLAQLLEDNMNGHYVDLESFASECTD